MIKLEIEVRDADYDNLIDRFLPMMIERLRQSDTPAARLISAGMPEAVIKAVLKKLPASAKDQLASDLINNNKDQIVQFLTDMAGQNGFRLDIGDVKAKANGN